MGTLREQWMKSGTRKDPVEGRVFKVRQLVVTRFGNTSRIWRSNNVRV